MQAANPNFEVELHVFPGVREVAAEAARRVAALAADKIATGGRFTIALSGGSTPKTLYNLLANPPYRDQLDWKNIFVFFGDERCVPPGDPESNFHMASETLLSKVPLPSQNVFRMRGEDPPEEGAAAYTRQLVEFFKLDPNSGPSPENLPKIDLILLGMGPDGHTASLFPGTAALQVRQQPVTQNFVPKLKANRITFTVPTINQAGQVLFLVVGPDKAESLKEVLEGEYQPQIYPSQLVRPISGSLVWLLDEAAASKLKERA